MWIDNEEHQGTLVTFLKKPLAKNHLPPNWTSSTHHMEGLKLVHVLCMHDCIRAWTGGTVGNVNRSV
jgi:hypothetical protein